MTANTATEPRAYALDELAGEPAEPDWWHWMEDHDDLLTLCGRRLSGSGPRALDNPHTTRARICPDCECERRLRERRGQG